MRQDTEERHAQVSCYGCVISKLLYSPLSIRFSNSQRKREIVYTPKKAINSKLTIAVQFWIKTNLLSGRFAKNIPSYAWYATHKKYCSGVVPNLAALCFQTKVKLYITGNLENGKKNSVQKQMFVQVTYRTP